MREALAAALRLGLRHSRAPKISRAARHRRADWLDIESVAQYQFGVIRILMLIVKPESAWNGIAHARHGLGFVLLGYLLPIALTASILEGLGMTAWLKWFVGTHGLIPFTLKDALVFETLHLASMFLVILACAFIIWMLGEPSYNRFNYRQALIVVIYSLSPWFVVQPLNAIPWITPWLPWAIGIMFSLRALYHGMPRMFDSTSGQALLLYFQSAASVVVLTCLEQVVFIQSLSSQGMATNKLVFDLAAKLPF